MMTMNDIDKLIHELNCKLKLIFSMVEINGIFVEQRDLVGIKANVRFEINSNDHPPPHFHIILNKDRKIRIRMKIENGEFIDGIENLSKQEKKQCQLFYEKNVDDLWKVWRKRD